MIVGLWFACWLIGRLPETAEFGAKMRRWAVSATIAGLVTMAAFKMLGPSPHELPWQPYTPVALEKARSEGKTVVIDFTAQWCLTCKWNLHNSINTPRVYDVVKQNDVVPLLADWTDRNDEIKQKLTELKSNSIPVFAVYPAGRPEDAVIILRDLVTEAQVVQAIKQAGPSQKTSENPTTTAAHQLPWQPYSQAALDKARAEGRTVLVNFKADWDVTGAFIRRNSLDTPRVKRLVDDNNVVTLLADYTHRDDSVQQKLDELKCHTIPAIAVYRAGQPESDVIVLRDLVSEDQVVQAISGPAPATIVKPMTAMNE
jgi:thiol:disulfide interchange protein